MSEKAGCDLAGSELSSSCCVAVVRQRGPDGGLQQLQMPAREDLNLPEEGLPEPESAGAGAETPPQEGTEQEVRDRWSLLLREDWQKVCSDAEGDNKESVECGCCGSGQCCSLGQFSRSLNSLSHELGAAFSFKDPETLQVVVIKVKETHMCLHFLHREMADHVLPS